MKRLIFALTVIGLAAATVQAQPANDNFANRIALSGATVTTTGSNVQATTQDGETTRYGSGGNRINWGATVWWVWTAPASGSVNINTIGSSFDTTLAVYTGTVINGTQVAFNNDIGGGTNTSSVTFTATAGTQYNIQVGGRSFFGIATGNITLRVAMAFSASITSPTNGAVFGFGENIPVSAAVTMPGTVTNVAFYRNGELAATDTTSPYSVTLSNTPLGAVALRVVASDSTGLSLTSSVVNVTVVNPGVTLTVPADGATYWNTNAITLTATTIGVTATNVEFFVDQQKIGEDAVSPYSITWSSVIPGSHALTAVARDSAGTMYVSPLVAIVVARTLVVSNSNWRYLDTGENLGTAWVAPGFDDSGWASGLAQLGFGDGDERTEICCSNATVKYVTAYFRHEFTVTNAASYTNLQLQVLRDDGAVVYLNGIEVGRFNMPAGTIAYDTLAPASANDDGTVFYTYNTNSFLVEGRNVLAVEVHQNSTTSSDLSFDMALLGVPVIVRNQSPVVLWANPTNSAALVAPATVAMAVSATDADGTVKGVEFFADGVSQGVVTNAPFEFAWNAPAIGFHTLKAEAVDDQGAKTASSIAITVHDEAGTPLAQITSPTHGTVITGLEGPTNLPIAAIAGGVGGVSNVQFVANGTLIGSDATSPYAVVWTNAAFGTNALTVVVYDGQGGKATSAVARVVIVEPPYNVDPPMVAAVTPARGAVITNLTSIQVVFSERVTGVNASDLLVNGVPAIAVAGSGSNYTFTVAQPAYGAVNITWATTHGIMDIGWPVALAFDELEDGNYWGYDLVDRTPPAVASRNPAAGATLTNLTQVSVSFTKPVTGVDAADFLVNGVPAIGLSGSGSNYTFAFAQPGSGTVAISWAANHGITDLVSPPNAFNATAAGNTWNYTLDLRTVLVADNASYKYFKGTSEASTPYNAWRFADFDDSAWAEGQAPFYYDVNTPPVYTGNTALTDMRNNYTCVFLRRRLVINNLAAVTEMKMDYRCDDGFVAWINGVEVARFGVTGEPSYTTLAANASSPTNLYTATLPDPKTYLVEGTNILAIQLFNTSLTSSDLLLQSWFYAYLADATLIPPRLASVAPVAGSVFYLTNVTVKFTEAVGGVDAADLLVNGVPATEVTGGTSNTTYTFSFPQPAYGTVQFTWAADHGITDFDQLAKPFDGAAAGSTWQYVLLNPNAPTVSAQTPVAGATVSNLTQITVTFSKPVTGVDAADLRINGLPASTVTGGGAAYTFTFAQPAYGTVAVAWVTNHGIKDFEIPANDFDSARTGNTWAYTLVDLVPPVVASQAPPAGAQVTNLTQITVTFSEPVAGVEASDLLINGAPASSVSGSGAVYTFGFSQPNATIVNITWAPAHGIHDLAASPNAFNATLAGSTWSYTTPDTLPPGMVGIAPPANITLRSLTEVQVTFSEPVAGVDAGDLLVNSRPARSVTGSGAGPYVFNFLSPSSGVVEVRWAPAHGITDLASPPNPLPGGEWTYWLDPDASFAGKVIINEIMFNPVGGHSADEWIELCNVSTNAINVAGWRFTRGVNYTFPNLSLPAGGYLVVAADVAAFKAKYPSVTNVVGGWTGALANGSETIELATALGETVNRVKYATEGDWGQRERGRGASLVSSITRSGSTATVTVFGHGYTSSDHVMISGADQPEYNGRFTIGNITASTFTITVSGTPASPATGTIICRQVLDNGQSGWSWFNAADGFGSSLELVNAALDNNIGQNWLASTNLNGTPGRANSVARANAAPFIRDVTHFPPVPKSTEPVYVTARVSDELTNGVQSVTLYYRDHTGTSPGAFNTLPLADNGANNDGVAGDGLYGVSLPAQANGTVIEFYLQATDTGGRSRTWPAAAWNTNGVYGQLANALYQVDNEVIASTMPSVRVVMTGTERAIFPPSDTGSDGEMNVTLITQDGGGWQVRYDCGVRLRGAGSRSRTPKNNRVNIPNDNPWNGLSAINLNCQFIHAQLAGNVLAQKSGLPAADAYVVQYRINGVNLAPATVPANGTSSGAGYGTFLLIQPVNGALAENLWPEDGDGNVYRASIYPHDANFSYQGTNPSSYVTRGYFKTSNRTENDWSDLIQLCYSMSQITAEADYIAAMQTNVNVELWMRYFAYGSMVNYGETSLFNGRGDDYALYRGLKDPRFRLIGHDFDTVFGQGDTTTYYPTLTNASIWIMLNPPATDPNVPLLRRFLTNAAFAPVFFGELKRLCDTTFHPTNLNPLFDQLLTGWGPDTAKITEMKNHAFNRRAVVLSQIPLNLTVNHSLASQNGYPATTSPNVTLYGTSHAIDTRKVLVNGVEAIWSPWEARWTNMVALRPGINRVLVQSVRSNNVVFAATNVDIWYDAPGQSVSGTISADTTWTAAGGPYNVTGNLTIANGATLTIQPGTTLYLGSGVDIVVANGGRLLAEGTPEAPIRFTRSPGATTTWGGLTVNGGVGSPETRIRYAHFEFNNDTAIDVNAGTVFLDHLTFGNTARQYLSLDGASFVVQDCTFPATTASFEPTHGTGGVRADGRGIFRRNFFGRISDYNDALDFTGGNRPGPILQVLNNVFMGSDDDLLDLDGTDAWVEGNIFLHIHRAGSSPDSASAISGGSDSGQTSEITIVRNLFFDLDHVANAKQGNFYTMLNNTIVKQNGVGSLDAETAVVILADPGTAQGAGIYLEGNIIHDAEKLTRGLTNAVVTYTNNLISQLQGAAWTGPGGGNVNADPLFKHVPAIAETTNFTTWAQAQVLWDWFSLQAGSPAAGKGPKGRDQGAVIPFGVAIFGEPQGATPFTTATLTVGENRTGSGIPTAGFPNGSGYTHYKWRLDGGPWSAETPIGTPIALSSLGVGPHYVEVSGKNDAGQYQDDPVFGADATVTKSRTWTVDPAALPLRLNEILAANGGAVNHEGTTPDMIELYNDGDQLLELEGLRLTDDPANPDKFIFPADAVIGPRSYLVVYANNADGTSGYHLGFNLSQRGESLYLYDSVLNGGRLLDSVTFGLQLTDLSIGRLADGAWALTTPTFGAVNQAARAGSAANLRINEWLALGKTPWSTDFIELYNLDPLPVALGGLYLSDEVVSWPARHAIAPLSFISGQGYLVLLADGDAKQGADHLNFQLSPQYGAIGLYQSDLTPIDIVMYGPQRENVSQGRTPNGSSTIAFLSQPTPGAPNPAASGAAPYGGALVINEVMAANTAEAVTFVAGGVTNTVTPDWVELYNGTTNMLALDDLSLTDDTTQPRRYVFPAGTTLPPGGFLRLYCDGALPLTNNSAGFGLNAGGGSLFLFNSPANGTGLVSSITYGFQAANLSVGRVPDGSTNWVLTLPTPASPNTAVAGLGSAAAVRINEWMANPNGGDDWFELYNPGSQPVALGGLCLTDVLDERAKHLIAPLSFLGAGNDAWRKLIADGNTGAGADHVGFSLRGAGEAIGLFTAAGAPVDAIVFGAQTNGVSEGRFPDGSTNIVRFPGTESPGQANYRLMTNVVINEALTHSDLPLEDAIELRNLTAQPIDLSGWWLSDDRGLVQKYQIPGGTLLPANGYVVIYENQFTNRETAAVPFALSSRGDEIVLAATTNNQLTGYRTAVKFGAAANGVSFGRYVNSVGEEQFVAMSARTFGVDDPATVELFRGGAGLPNAYPLVGPIVISEIMYHPPDVGTNDNVAEEYIELLNLATVPVALYDPAYPTNVWRLRDAVDFDFPANTVIGPGEYLLVVSFDPVNNPTALAAFRAKYSLATNVAIVGPYAGKLANNSDSVELCRPDAPDAGEVPYILVDRVKYSDTAPWPAAADGTGQALRRVMLSDFGNDPANWVADFPSPGPAAAPLDIDGDGLPNAWELANGFDPFNPADGLADSDGDGLRNWQEYLAGTDPLDPASTLRLRVIAPTMAQTNVVLSFTAAADRGYQVEYSATPTGLVWQVLGEIPAAPSNRPVVLPVSPSDRLRIYRVRTQ